MGSLALSSSACEMFLVLKEHLHTVEQRLSRSLFVLCWNKVANELNRFLYEEVGKYNLYIGLLSTSVMF